MADRIRPTDYRKGPPCVLCGWPNVKPGHNAKERQTLRDSPLRDLIGVLFAGR
jgi:hypothetical protein